MKREGYLLAVLWAFALVTSLNGAVELPESLLYRVAALSVGLSACILLWRPSSRFLLAASAVSLVCLVLTQLPIVQNHRMVLTLIAVLLLLPARGAQSEKSGDRFVLRLHALNALTVVVYVFAVVAKLNVDYLTRAASCAGQFLRHSLIGHGLPETLAGWSDVAVATAWWSLISEAAIIILLVVPSTRRWGILLGVLFHLALATDYVMYFANFSCVMFVLLASWMTPGQQERAWKSGSGFWRVVVPGLGSSMVALWIAAAFGVLAPTSWIIVRHVLFLVFALGLTWQLGAAVLSGGDREPGVPSYRVLSLQSVVLLLAVVNGLSPYIGLKTRSAFSMYSNLRIEPGFSNHWFMPPSSDPLRLFADPVLVERVDEASYDKFLGGAGQEFPYIVVCDFLARTGAVSGIGSDTASISFSRNGVSTTLSRNSPLPEDCPPWILRKLLFFGPVGPGSEERCIW